MGCVARKTPSFFTHLQPIRFCMFTFRDLIFQHLFIFYLIVRSFRFFDIIKGDFSHFDPLICHVFHAKTHKKRNFFLFVKCNTKIQNRDNLRFGDVSNFFCMIYNANLWRIQFEFINWNINDRWKLWFVPVSNLFIIINSFRINWITKDFIFSSLPTD